VLVVPFTVVGILSLGESSLNDLGVGNPLVQLLRAFRRCHTPGNVDRDMRKLVVGAQKFVVEPSVLAVVVLEVDSVAVLHVGSVGDISSVVVLDRMARSVTTNASSRDWKTRTIGRAIFIIVVVDVGHSLLGILFTALQKHLGRVGVDRNQLAHAFGLCLMATRVVVELNGAV
jgi:hypothetical protein